MTSFLAERVEDRERIIESILAKSQCHSCGHKMDMSIFIDLDTDRPLQTSWVCAHCSHLGQSMCKHELGFEIPGTSRSERLASILYITHALADSTRSMNKLNALNDLLQIAAAEGIRLSYLDFASTPTVRGVYFKHDGIPYIMLDETLKSNPIDHVEVLAEEVGRYFANKSALFNHNDSVREEVFALRWALKFLASVPENLNSRVS